MNNKSIKKIKKNKNNLIKIKIILLRKKILSTLKLFNKNLNILMTPLIAKLINLIWKITNFKTNTN
jgi:hypothetical protein